ncbi:MAG: AAA family ATPase [Jatrophihabitans sp.]|uniref:AAA family ATPase n=1 Tax=Jatrophihabitans sp. TaxID=1932789 RepID=UPI003F7E89AC
MPNPYHYGSPVTGDQFTGRHHEVNTLVERMRDGINVVVVSPRRYGKTSLLRRAAEIVERDGGAVVSVSAMGLADARSLAGQLLRQTYRLDGGRWHRAKQAVPTFLSRLRVKPTVTFNGDQPSFSFAATLSSGELDDIVADVYAVLAEVAPRKPSVLIVDEFQDVLDLGPHLPGLFKSLADRHPTVSLVLAGSKQHVMQQLTLESTGPLYGMTSRLALAPIPPEEMGDFLVRRATAGQKRLSVTLADRIVELAGPVPNDIQYLAYEVYNTAGRTITASDVETGMRLAVEHEADFDAWRFAALAPGQRRVLRRLAEAPTATPYADDFRDAVQARSPGALRNSLTRLLQADLATMVDGTYRVTSPFFAAWLRSHV